MTACDTDHIDQFDRTERETLGGMLRWPDSIGDVVIKLCADDFRTYHHRLVFTAIVSLWNSGKPVDAVSVANHLQLQGQIADIGGYGFLASLLELAPTSAATAHHAAVVRQRSIIRCLNRTAQEIAGQTAMGTGDPEQLLEEAERKILAIGETGYSGGAVRLAQALKETFSRIEERENRKGEIAGVPTGLADLDALTSGLHDSEVSILAARTSVGKTTLALQIVKHAAIDLGLPVIFVSLEMSRMELVERLLCAVGRVDNWRVRQGKMTDDDAARLWDARRQITAAPLFIDDEPHQRMLRIAATARRLKQQAGLRLLVVDYLQLIEPDDRKLPRHEQVSQVSRRLKGLSKELNIPVLALAQLSRAAEEKERPKLHHLRESGSLEQDADCVLLMHRPEDEPNVVEVDVAKQRNGPTGSLKLTFEKQYTRFEDYAYGLPPVGT